MIKKLTLSTVAMLAVSAAQATNCRSGGTYVTSTDATGRHAKFCADTGCRILPAGTQVIVNSINTVLGDYILNATVLVKSAATAREVRDSRGTLVACALDQGQYESGTLSWENQQGAVFELPLSCDN